MGTDGFALNNSFSPHFALGESNQVATMLLLVVMHIVVAVLGYLVRKPFGPISAIFELLHSSYYFTEGLLSTWLEYESKFCFFFGIFLLFPCNSRIIWISILLGFWRSFIDTFFFMQQIVPPVLNSFADQDSRVRYYACEALYNIAKVRKNLDFY